MAVNKLCYQLLNAPVNFTVVLVAVLFMSLWLSRSLEN
uniref:Uncharacterized protein n=1 Tax=Rhizophora mucronata TaxID=61149 RepID=A0A2P2N025_RHIMU